MPLDKTRRAQLANVRTVLFTSGWITLAEIAVRAGNIGEASASARVRDLRKTQHGGYTIEKRKLYGQLFQYRMCLGGPVQVKELEPAPGYAHGKTRSSHAGTPA